MASPVQASRIAPLAEIADLRDGVTGQQEVLSLIGPRIEGELGPRLRFEARAVSGALGVDIKPLQVCRVETRRVKRDQKETMNGRADSQHAYSTGCRAIVAAPDPL